MQQSTVLIRARGGQQSFPGIASDFRSGGVFLTGILAQRATGYAQVGQGRSDGGNKLYCNVLKRRIAFLRLTMTANDCFRICFFSNGRGCRRVVHSGGASES